MIIDIHTHIWSHPDGRSVRDDNKQALLAIADRLGLAGMVVMPLFGGHYPTSEEVEAGNDAAAAFAQEDPRVWPFVSLWPPNTEAAMRELRRRIEEQGFHGLKVWICYADHPSMDPLIERMIGYNRPTLIHALNKSVGQLAYESDPTHIARLARRYPEAKLIMAHVGGQFILGCDAIADCPNVYTDISGSHCDQGMVEYAVRTLGAERVLFGSDGPFVSTVACIAEVAAAQISEEDKARILHGNAETLLNPA